MSLLQFLQFTTVSGAVWTVLLTALAVAYQLKLEKRPIAPLQIKIFDNKVKTYQFAAQGSSAATLACVLFLAVLVMT